MHLLKIYFISLICFSACNSVWAFKYSVSNLTKEPRDLIAKYKGFISLGKKQLCGDDKVSIPAGETVVIDAKGCPIKSLTTPDGSSYQSTGQIFYKEFYIIGPIDKGFKVGRFAKD